MFSLCKKFSDTSKGQEAQCPSSRDNAEITCSHDRCYYWTHFWRIRSNDFCYFSSYKFDFSCREIFPGVFFSSLDNSINRTFYFFLYFSDEFFWLFLKQKSFLILFRTHYIANRVFCNFSK